MGKTRDQWCHRMRGIGLPRDLGYRLLDQVVRWKACSGPEWTVNRLKSVKTDLIRYHAGLPPTGTWYAKRANGTPSGVLGELWSQPLAKAIAALNVYTTMVSHNVTPSQWRKFYTSVHQEGDFMVVPPLVRETVGVLPKWRPYAFAYEGFHTLPTSPTKRAPGDLWKGKTVPETEWYRSLWDVALSPAYAKAYSTFSCFGRTVDNSPQRIDFDSLLPVTDRRKVADIFIDEIVGKISFIQEPGYKLRAVANPHRLHQAVLEPLKKALLNYLRGIRGDCTFNQESGIKATQLALQQGKTVYSIDMSDATNNFPLGFQVLLLESLGFPVDDLSYFVAVSRGKWNLPRSGVPTDSSTIQWTKGQPLGLGPSFPSFAIAHHAVVRMAQRDTRVKGEVYSILGDDIVIYDDRVAEKYLSFLDQLGCPISESKTLRSNKLAEFAGRIISADNSIPSPKWRQMSDDNFIDVVRVLGPQAVSLLRPRQRRVFKIIAPLPEPVGLGWNPKGLSLDDRWSLYERLSSDGETSVRYRNSLSHHFRTMSYLVNSDKVDPWTQTTVSSTFVKGHTEPRPTRPKQSTYPVKERIMSLCGVFEEQSEITSFAGFTPLSTEHDWKTSRLSVLEKKLDI